MNYCSIRTRPLSTTTRICRKVEFIVLLTTFKTAPVTQLQKYRKLQHVVHRSHNIPTTMSAKVPLKLSVYYGLRGARGRESRPEPHFRF